MLILSVFSQKLKKKKNGFRREMKSLPHENIFIFPQKRIGGKLQPFYILLRYTFGAIPSTLDYKNSTFSPKMAARQQQSERCLSYLSTEYIKRRVCIVNVQWSLHENVIFSVCAPMGNAVYIIFIIWKSISGWDAWYYFRLNISCGVAVRVRSHQQRFQVNF